MESSSGTWQHILRRGWDVVDAMIYRPLILHWINIILIFTCVNLFGEEAERFDGNPAGRFSDEEYRIIRYLENNPIDPNKTDIEDLMSIPGFSRALAERVIKAVNKAGCHNKWILFLSPDDRNRIYKYSDLLILPHGGDYDISLRYTRSYFPDIVECREDGYILIDSRLSGFKARIRRDNNIDEAAVYAKFNLPGRKLSFHAGDFLPDFAMGLLSSGRTFYYPFSYRYPLNNYRWICKGTYFYGKATRGMAAEYKRKIFRILFYNGMVREYDDGKFDFSGYILRGGRAEAEIGKSRFGLSIVEEKGSASTGNAGLDSRFKSGNLDIAFELGLSANGGRAFSCAGKMKNRKSKTGFILYRVNHLFSNSTGRIPADGRKINGEQTGMAAVIDKKIKRGIDLRFSVERWFNRRSYNLANKMSYDIQINRKFNKNRMRLEWKHVEYQRETTLPKREINTSDSNSLKLLFLYRRFKHIRLRNSVAVPWGGDYSGCLIAPSMTLSLLDGHLKGDISLACFKAIEGAPSFYYYQPSADGNFPWKNISGSGFRGTIGFKIYCRKTMFNIILSADSSELTDLIFQAIIKL